MGYEARVAFCTYSGALSTSVASCFAQPALRIPGIRSEKLRFSLLLKIQVASPLDPISTQLLWDFGSELREGWKAA